MTNILSSPVITRGNASTSASQFLFDLPALLSFHLFPHALYSTGRVYLLSFYGEKRFFWMQEPNADKDAE